MNLENTLLKDTCTCITHTRTRVHTLVVIKNFYEKKKKIFNPFYEATRERSFFYTWRLGKKKESISSREELFRKVGLSSEKYGGIFTIQRGCNCTSTMVVPKERTKRGMEEEREKRKGKDGIDRMKPGILRSRK